LADLQRRLDLPTPVHRGFVYRVDVPAGTARTVALEFAPSQVRGGELVACLMSALLQRLSRGFCLVCT
jgi:hypothetical protein